MKFNEHFTTRESTIGFVVDLAPSLQPIAWAFANQVARTKIPGLQSFIETPTGVRFCPLDVEQQEPLLELLNSIELDELMKMEHERKLVAAARLQFLALPTADFGEMLNTASSDKLRYIASSDSTLRLRPTELLPVTHFKKLAKIGRWNASDGNFEFTIPLQPLGKDKLLAAASAVGRSTKKVTKDDIVARRKAILAKNLANCPIPKMDFEEAAQACGTAWAMSAEAAGLLKI